MYKRLNISDEEIISKYKEIGEVVKTANFLNISPCYITRSLKRNNIEIKKWRKNQFNDHYFDEIDCEEKAYFLGFLWADGNNFYSEERGKVSIKLSEKDREILEVFKKLIQYESPLQHVKNIQCTDKNGKIHNCKDAYSLNLNSLRMSKYMDFIGLHPNKTDTLRLPSFGIVPENLYHHFIRGFFDGDGSISKHIQKFRNKYTFHVEICMKNLNLCNDFILIFNKFINLNPKYRFSSGVNKIYFCSFLKQIKFLDWIYKEAKIFLKRKRDLYLELNSCKESWYNFRTSKIRDISVRNGVYIVRKYINSKIKTLGRFKTEKEAITCLKLNNYAIT